MSARYSEPTSKQAEEAKALIFLSETKKALRDQEHIWDLTLELEVRYSLHNQRVYTVHAATRDGQTVTGPEGHRVHPITGTPSSTAWFLSIEAKAARKQLADH